MKGKINEQNHDMIAYSFANFGMAKRLSQDVESILPDKNNKMETFKEKEKKEVDLFEDDTHLHFF